MHTYCLSQLTTALWGRSRNPSWKRQKAWSLQQGMVKASMTISSPSSVNDEEDSETLELNVRHMRSRYLYGLLICWNLKVWIRPKNYGSSSTTMCANSAHPFMFDLLPLWLRRPWLSPPGLSSKRWGEREVEWITWLKQATVHISTRYGARPSGPIKITLIYRQSSRFGKSNSKSRPILVLGTQINDPHSRLWLAKET